MKKILFFFLFISNFAWAQPTAFNAWVPTLSTASNLTGAAIVGVQGGASKQFPGTLFQSPITFGTGVQTALGINIGSAGAPILFNGAGGTPSSLTGTNITGIPLSTGITGFGSGWFSPLGTALGSGWAGFFATPSSANLASTLTDETGSGVVVFGTTPTLATPVINGLPTGTGISNSATLSTLAARDVNANLSATNFLSGYTTTATAAGTTTLTVASNYYQYFTGSTTQTVTMPVTSTLVLGQSFYITNNSSGVVTVQTSGSNTLVAMAANSILVLQCILTSGTGTASWNYNYYPPNPMTTTGDIIYGGAVAGGYATPTRLGAGTSGLVLTSNGGGVAPSWQAGGGLSGLSTNGVVVATSSTTIGTNADFTYAARFINIGLSSSGTNTIQLGQSGNSFIMNNSTGELRISTASTYFPTLYSSGVEILRGQPNNHKTISIGSTSENAALYISQIVLTTAWLPSFRLDPGPHTGMTAGAEFSTSVFTGSTQTWAAGSATLANQRYNYFKAPTVNAGSGNTFTDTYTGYFEVPINGSGTTTNLWALGTNGAMKIGGSLTVTGTSTKIAGTATNDAAIAGNIGEEINAIQSTYTNYTTTVTYQNITSVTLTAGDWDLSALYTYSSNSATITAASNAIFVISTTTASASGATEGLNIAYVPQAALLGTSKFTDVIGPYRVSISGTTTYYLNSQAAFSVGNPQFVGEIRARRIR